MSNLRYYINIEEKPFETPKFIWSVSRVEPTGRGGLDEKVVAQGRARSVKRARRKAEKALRKYQQAVLISYEVKS